MKNVDLIIHARWVIPVDAKQSVLEHHSVVVNDGRIVALIPPRKSETEIYSHQYSSYG